MNISVIIQGEGKGHFSQAMEAIELAQAQGAKVTGCYMGRSLFRNMPGYFRNTSTVPLRTFLSPNFLRTPDRKGIHVLLSLLLNTLLSPVYLFEVVRLGIMLRRDSADQLLNFYDPVGALAGKWFRRRTRKVCISHHFYLSHPDFIHPHGLERSYFWLQLMNHILIRKADEVLALSFRKGSSHGKIRVVPPLVSGDLRKAANIREAGPENQGKEYPGNYEQNREGNRSVQGDVNEHDAFSRQEELKTGGNTLYTGIDSTKFVHDEAENTGQQDLGPDLCYFLNPGFVQEILAYYREHPGQQADIFTEDPGQFQAPGNVRVHATGREKFLTAMQHAGRVICTAGFDTVAEAFYLGIPVFVIPSENHYEQYCNALDAARTGMAFQLESIDDMCDAEFSPASNTRFLHWLNTGPAGIISEPVK